MPKTINELKKFWELEKDGYENVEVGTGVQRFVKDVFRCKELFSLKEGNLTTDDLIRRKEYTVETGKKTRRADVVIFINSDIIIPVEIERYKNIETGVQQIFNYQVDWVQKYGLLTDGDTWRFYNNRYPVKSFKLKRILENPKEFLDFWNEYILPENYYLYFFEKVGQEEIFAKDDPNVDDKREDFFVDITKLIGSFKNKLNIKGYFDNLSDEEMESQKRAVEITYAYIIQFILYKTLVDNDYGTFRNDFRDRIETIHNAIKTKSYKEILTTIKGISEIISENIYRPFSKEQEFINITLDKVLYSPKGKLDDVTPWLDIFVFIKRYNFSNIQNEIFGYIYENYLKDLYLDENKGQYFTDPAIVNFMLEQIGYNSKNIKKRLNNNPEEDYVSVIDPSCGSGTFLYSATNKILDTISNNSNKAAIDIENIINNNIYGLDIAEFPLYLAEMNILMRMLPIIIDEKYNNPVLKKIKVFKTRDSIAEFMDTGIKEEPSSLFEKKQIELEYTSYVRDEEDLKELKDSLETYPTIPRKRFDYVIGNPPYVSYNESSRQKILIFDWIKDKRAKLNNIYGVNLHSTPDNPKKYRPNPNLYTFFIALGLALLKDNGKLCYIIPQTVLVNPDFDVVRYHLSKFTTIKKIITFNCRMFIGRGIKQNRPIPTSSLIFIVERTKPNKDNTVDIVHYTDFNDDIEVCLKNLSLGKKTKFSTIKQSNLLANIVNWNIINQDEEFLKFYTLYKDNSEDMNNYYTHLIARQKFNSYFVFDGGYSINEKNNLEEPQKEVLNYGIPILDNNYWTIKEFSGYWPNIRDNERNKMFIALRQGSQAYDFLDSPYKIIWSYNNTSKFFYTDKEIIWARNKYLGIGSDNRDEIFYLFAIFNSKITSSFLVNLIKLSNEDTRTILVSLQIIKDQLRTPVINKENKHIKNEIISKVKDFIELDNLTVKDFVDLSGITIHKFDNVNVSGNNLILNKDGNNIKCKIRHSPESVNSAIANILYEGKLFKTDNILLSELKNLPVIDYQKQKELKEYIDDLVFALYFNIKINFLGLKYSNNIKRNCKNNPYYKLINQID